MKQSLKDFFEGVSIKNTLFTIIWTIGILAWIYFGVSFTETRAEANWTYQESIKLKIERENKNEDDAPAVESKDEAAREVSLEAATEDQIAVASPSNQIEKIIYEVAKEKNFSQPEILVRIARAESSLNPCVKNPNSSAIGIFQILDMHNLSKEERCNPRIATAWAIDHFAGGRPWNSSRSKWENM